MIFKSKILRKAINLTNLVVFIFPVIISIFSVLNLKPLAFLDYEITLTVKYWLLIILGYYILVSLIYILYKENFDKPPFEISKNSYFYLQTDSINYKELNCYIFIKNNSNNNEVFKIEIVNVFTFYLEKDNNGNEIEYNGYFILPDNLNNVIKPGEIIIIHDEKGKTINPYKKFKGAKVKIDISGYKSIKKFIKLNKV